MVDSEYVYLTSAFSTLLKERNAQSITDCKPRQTSLKCLLLMNITSNIVLAGRNLSKCCNWRGWLPPEPCHWARCREGRPRWWAHCKDSLPTTRSPPSRRPEVCEVSYFYRYHYRYCVSLQTLTCWTRGCRREETPPRAPAQWMDPGLRTVKFNSPDCSQVRKLRILFSHDAHFNFPFLQIRDVLRLWDRRPTWDFTHEEHLPNLWSFKRRILWWILPLGSAVSIFSLLTVTENIHSYNTTSVARPPAPRRRRRRRPDSRTLVT